MDIRQLAEYKKALKDISDLSQDVLEASRKQRYRLYRWRSSYIVEDMITEQTICMRVDLKLAINAAIKDHHIDSRDIMLDI